MRNVAEGRRRNGSPFEKCTLGKNYVSVDNGLSTSPHFKTGASKIQQGVTCKTMMNRRESEACKLLLDDDGTGEGSLDFDDNADDLEFDFAKVVAAGEKKKEIEVTGKSKHVDCRCIMGTAACVERLEREGDNVQTKRRKGMSPITLELILFLKKKEGLWSLEDVVEADKRRKVRNKKQWCRRK